MQLRVTHETVYEYATPVVRSQHRAILRPIDGSGQGLLRHGLQIVPAPATRVEGVDGFGNRHCDFSFDTPHHQLRVLASSEVSTVPWVPVPDEFPWDSVARSLFNASGLAGHPLAPYMGDSRYVRRDAAFADYAMPSFTPARPLLEAARDLMARIHADFAYLPQSTDVDTTARVALDLRRGVCQDFAHVMIACLRSLGLPARYVSGYLLNAPEVGQPRLVGSDASHAWAAVWLPGPALAGHEPWMGLDPTNNRAPGEDYVVLAHGRDYGDVSPVSGTIQGGGAQHTLRVAVTVEPLSSQTPQAQSQSQTQRPDEAPAPHPAGDTAAPPVHTETP